MVIFIIRAWAKSGAEKADGKRKAKLTQGSTLILSTAPFKTIRSATALLCCPHVSPHTHRCMEHALQTGSSSHILLWRKGLWSSTHALPSMHLPKLTPISNVTTKKKDPPPRGKKKLWHMQTYVPPIMPLVVSSGWGHLATLLVI